MAFRVKNLGLPIGATLNIARIVSVGRIGWQGKEMRMNLPNVGLILERGAGYSFTVGKIYMGTNSSHLAFTDQTSKLSRITLSWNGEINVIFSSAPDGTSDHFALVEFDGVVITRDS